MAPSIVSSSLSPAAPAYFPKSSGAPRNPPPPHAPGLVTYISVPQPEFLPCPPLAPPPPLPCWGVPVPGMHAAAFHGGVVPHDSMAMAPPMVPGLAPVAFHGGVVPHVAMAMAPPTGPGPAPDAWPPRRHLHAPRLQRAAGPALAASCGVKSAVDAVAATNQPSPRSVLVVTSPPISPTTSLPASFPYQLALPASPAATAGLASAVAPCPAEGTVALRPLHRPRWRPRGGRRLARHPSTVFVRRTVKPRRMFDSSSERRLRGGPSRAPHPSTVSVRRTVKPRRIFDGSSERTSLMIRNIPNDFTRTRLMNILDEHCFIENEKIAPGGVRSEYDFLYLPIDFRSHANKGFAFVNMTSPEAARRLWEDLNGLRWAFKRTAKTCAVDYAVLQGLDELVEHFSESRFDCHTEEFLPVRFEPPRDGTRPAEGAMHVVGRLGRPRAGDVKK